MRKITSVLAGAIFAMLSASAQAGDLLSDFGWGGRYNAHLSEYDGRPLGPPLPALPPCHQYYNGRLIRVPYCYQGPYLYGPYGSPAQVRSIRVRPHHVRMTRAARIRHASRRY